MWINKAYVEYQRNYMRYNLRKKKQEGIQEDIDALIVMRTDT